MILDLAVNNVYALYEYTLDNTPTIERVGKVKIDFSIFKRYIAESICILLNNRYIKSENNFIRPTRRRKRHSSKHD